MEDDILREIREYREAYAAKFNYDVEAMCRDLRERSLTSGHRVVSIGKDGVVRVIREASPDQAEPKAAGPAH